MLEQLFKERSLRAVVQFCESSCSNRVAICLRFYSSQMNNSFTVLLHSKTYKNCEVVLIESKCMYTALEFLYGRPAIHLKHGTFKIIHNFKS